MTLLVGGARSGKSSLAVDIGHRHAAAGIPVTYVATAPPVDEDMAERIERHRAERPETWTTIEEEVDLLDVFVRVGHGLVIIDCLTLWTSNLMCRELTDEQIVEHAVDTARAAASREEPTVAITNEVGLGIHPETDLGRRYRDLLGRVNQVWAEAADTALLLVAGQATRLDDPWSLM